MKCRELRFLLFFLSVEVINIRIPQNRAISWLAKKLAASENGLLPFEIVGGLQSQCADGMAAKGTRRYQLCCPAVTPALEMSVGNTVGLRLFTGFTGQIMLVHALKI